MSEHMAEIRTKEINISDNLITILKKISNKSHIANLLLNKCISLDELNEEHIDYISVAKDDYSKISYINKNKINKVEDDDFWNYKGRVQSKPAVAIRKLFKNITDQELDIFANLYKSAIEKKEFEFHIVSGDDIKTYYHYNSYNNNIGGSLHNSCMKYDHCLEYFEIYTKNADVCKMVVMLDSDYRLLGRALLWNAIDIETGEEVKVMDRIYCVNDDKNKIYFKSWADENGYIHRKDQKWFNCLSYESNGKQMFKKLSVKLKKLNYKKFPYTDTFKFLDIENLVISNFIPSDASNIVTLISNDGRHYGNNVLAHDNYNNTYDHRDRLRTLTYRINDETIRTTEDNLTYSNTMDMYILKPHSIYDEDLNDYIFNEEYDSLNNKQLIEDRRIAMVKKRRKAKLADIEVGIAKVEFAVFNTTNNIDVINDFTIDIDIENIANNEHIDTPFDTENTENVNTQNTIRDFGAIRHDIYEPFIFEIANNLINDNEVLLRDNNINNNEVQANININVDVNMNNLNGADNLINNTDNLNNLNVERNIYNMDFYRYYHRFINPNEIPRRE